MESLVDQVAVITGGASGIGLALARALAAEGCQIVIADIEEEALKSASVSLAGDVLAVQTDVSKIEAVEALAAATLERFGRVDILCNNAGISTFNTLENQTLDDWRWVLDVDLWGVIHGVHTFLPIMRRQGTPGHIVNTASVAGLLSGVPYLGPYAVSKVGVVSISETLRIEMMMAGDPIGVSVLCPSGTNTSVMEAERNRPVQAGSEQRTRDAEEMRLMIRSGFTGPNGKEPAEIAARVVHAIRNDTFWVVTHNDMKPQIEMRLKNILEAIPKV
ncbi:MAG TPA: SDR family NAD(P)-dependent oxidoreductase [Frankiaceae bacterium]|jgi:NAD(P)-dependent dehydrogenase (short-subunit alcohol dehydrogenase family)|nr:SDR family NAD(P)-dependent oxidoreductase [Frankiaceae bacterium]